MLFEKKIYFSTLSMDAENENLFEGANRWGEKGARGTRKATLK
jgi:hypothetical protein